VTRAVLLAAPSSGSGKTTVALGLMRALADRGLTVAPFKAGPDYIDPGLHRIAAGRPSRNLDTWMMPPERLAASFAGGCRGADVALVEGVMGLFDGSRGAGEPGSSAHLAKSLGIPVILVLDAGGMAGSAAAVAHGFSTLDPALGIAGVILNRVASDNHLMHLTEAIAGHTRVPVLGHLMRDQALTLGSRHLGLVTADEVADPELFTRLGRAVAAGVDLDALLAAVPDREWPLAETTASVPRARLGVARDRAFCFAYPDNLEMLENAGAELVFFSPLEDTAPPDRVDGLYLPGGYPELHGEALAANRSMGDAIRSLAEAGMPMFAECGGLIYLSRAVHTRSGDFPMCGVLPADCHLESRRQALGYRTVTLDEDGLLGAAGGVLRGHEFRYSRVDEGELDRAAVPRVLTLTPARGGPGRAEGFRLHNVLATYAHVLLTETAARAWVDQLVARRP